MFHPADIRALMAEEIELVTLACRARKRIQAPDVHDDDFDTTLNVLAGQVPDEEMEEAA